MIQLDHHDHDDKKIIWTSTKTMTTTNVLKKNLMKSFDDYGNESNESLRTLANVSIKISLQKNLFVRKILDRPLRLIKDMSKKSC